MTDMCDVDRENKVDLLLRDKQREMIAPWQVCLKPGDKPGFSTNHLLAVGRFPQLPYVPPQPASSSQNPLWRFYMFLLWMIRWNYSYIELLPSSYSRLICIRRDAMALLSSYRVAMRVFAFSPRDNLNVETPAVTLDLSSMADKSNKSLMSLWATEPVHAHLFQSAEEQTMFLELFKTIVQHLNSEELCTFEIWNGGTYLYRIVDRYPRKPYRYIIQLAGHLTNHVSAIKQELVASTYNEQYELSLEPFSKLGHVTAIGEKHPVDHSTYKVLMLLATIGLLIGVYYLLDREQLVAVAGTVIPVLVSKIIEWTDEEKRCHNPL
jgi:hypothetical protein